MRKIKFNQLSKFEASKIKGGDSTGGACCCICQAGSSQGYANLKKEKEKQKLAEFSQE